MTIIEFTTPVLPEDDDIPNADDPRLKPLIDQLVAAGVMNSEGILIIPQAKLLRGMQPPHDWVWRVEYEEAAQPAARPA